MREVIQYKCEFCGKIMVFPKAMERHEKQCTKNPNTFNCFMCENAYIKPGMRGWPICAETGRGVSENIASECSSYKRANLIYSERVVSDNHDEDCNLSMGNNE